MRKTKTGIFLVLALILGFLWWQQYKQDHEFMNNLLLHKPIALNQIDAIHVWVKCSEIKKVPTKDYLKVVEWFNHYPPNRVAEEKVPLSDAQFIIDLKYPNPNGTIVINYMQTDRKIYVGTNGANAPSYMFLDDAPELINFFEELIKQS